MRPRTLMSFSQLIHRFTCKWLLKGDWLRLPSACTYHANVMLSDTYKPRHTQAENSGVEEEAIKLKKKEEKNPELDR